MRDFYQSFVKKLFYMFFMLFLISIISFSAIHLAPHTFFASGDLNPNITQEAIDQLKKVYGLDKPLYIQYLSWLSSILQLNFGISFSSGKSVSDEILSRLPVTLILNIISMFFIFVISLFFGIYAAFRHKSKRDFVIKQLSLVSFAFPSFYLAIIFIQIFALWLGLFPINGLVSANSNLNFYLDAAWHLILPISVVVFGGIGSLSLYIRSLTLEILKSDYIFFAKARGIGGYRLLRYYILPNLLPSIVTMLGLSLPSIIGGSVILESIFGIEGMGLLFYQSALSRDYPVIMGILIIGAFLTLLGNMLADMALAKLNPFFKSKK